MSYDLLAFAPNVAPRDRTAFKDWWGVQSQWAEDHGYDDPSVTTNELRRWYEEMTKHFPDIRALSDDDDVGEKTSDYSIGKSVVYVGFPWTAADQAYDEFRRLAVEFRVGFYEVSADPGSEELFFPGDKLRPPSQGKWREVAADFRSGDLSKYIPQSKPPKRRWWDIFRRNQ
ncbi:MAG: hypothetical protein AAF250_12250 [Pseudomonadota bacterium]